MKKTSLASLSGALRVTLSLKSNSWLLVIIGKNWSGNKGFLEDFFLVSSIIFEFPIQLDTTPETVTSDYSRKRSPPSTSL